MLRRHYHYAISFIFIDAATIFAAAIDADFFSLTIAAITLLPFSILSLPLRLSFHTDIRCHIQRHTLMITRHMPPCRHYITPLPCRLISYAFHMPCCYFRY